MNRWIEGIEYALNGKYDFEVWEPVQVTSSTVITATQIIPLRQSPSVTNDGLTSQRISSGLSNQSIYTGLGVE